MEFGCAAAFYSGACRSRAIAVKRANRLRRPYQFQRVRREGRVVSQSLIRLTAAPNRRRQTRCGIVAGKHLGKAVQRNRARRRVREAIRLQFSQIRPGYDLVFYLRSQDILTVPFATVQAAIREVLRAAHIWRDVPTALAADAGVGVAQQPPQMDKTVIDNKGIQ